MKSSWKKAALGLAVVGILVGGFAQPASAAYSNYYSGKTVKLSQKNSAAQSGIAGGRGSLGISTADFYINLITESGTGGSYTRYGSASGSAPGNVYMGHPTVQTAARVGCYWSVGDSRIQGELTLTCAVNR